MSILRQMNDKAIETYIQHDKKFKIDDMEKEPNKEAKLENALKIWKQRNSDTKGKINNNQEYDTSPDEMITSRSCIFSQKV